MPGFRHSPFEDIQRIRQDLRDRYHEGFPILKELIQNTDDAGAGRSGATATKFVIVLCKNGLPGATHTLLRDAGLCIINNGSFTAEDANSITSLGLSNKGGQEGAAGKFGLGLKSIFHWAEAFFYFSPHTFAGDSKLQSEGCELLNPWWSRYAETGRHRNWDVEWQKTKQGDLSAFGQFASATLDTTRWFGLWIPLRISDHILDGDEEVKPIESRFPKPDLNEILGHNWCGQLAAMMPLLRRVHTVQVFEHSESMLSPIKTLQVNEHATRMQFGTKNSSLSSCFSEKLNGKVLSSDGLNEVHFAGHERMINVPVLSSLRQHRAWPVQSAIGIDGEDLQIKEKGESHGAVLFTRQAATGQSYLWVQPAVFLPLGKPEANFCKGDWSYYLYLHGFFFVDSGRRHIQNDDGLTENLTPEKAASESEVIRLWNRHLMREVVAPMVLPALEEFVHQESMDSAEIESLVATLQHSKVIGTLNEWVCSDFRFFYQLRPTDCQWVLEKCFGTDGKIKPWVELPMPDFPIPELFLLLPGLTDMSNQTAVCLKGKPSLASHKPKRLSDEQLASLLNKVPVSTFEDASRLDYMLTLIPDDASQSSTDLPLSTRLVEIANQLLVYSQPENKELRELWSKFFQRLSTKVIVRLPVESTKVSKEIAKTFATVSLPVALLWQDYRDATGTGMIPWATLLSVLKQLSALMLDQELEVKQRSDVAVRLLNAAVEQTESWKTEIEKLPLFASREPGGKVRATSLGQLWVAATEGRLFTSGENCAQDLVKAAPELKPLLAVSDVTEVLKLTAPNCDLDACVRLLKTASRLAADFTKRKTLFERLLGEAQSDDEGAWAALRCLLHGEVLAWQETATLFDETGAAPVLLKLLAKALAAAQQWRRLTAQVVGQLGLTAEHRNQLNLVAVADATIEELLREVGPTSVDCSGLSTEDCDFILERFNDMELLRDLNIHETVDGHRVRIGPHTYVDEGTFTNLPAEFNALVMRLRDRPGYARFSSPDGSNRLVNKLSWEAVIELALSQPNPCQWAGAILTGISHLGNLRATLRERVCNVSWLPLADGSSVRPSDLLHVPGAEMELDQLPPQFLNGRVPLLQLGESVRNQDGFDTFKKTILPSIQEALETLADLLQHAGWTTGVLGEWTTELVSDWVKVMEGVPLASLPLAALVRAMHTEQGVRELMPGFLQSISNSSQLGEAAYANVLKHLANKHVDVGVDNRPPIERVFKRYIAAVASQGRVTLTACLRRDGVRLLSKAGSWKSASQLAFPSDNLRDEDTVTDALTEMLASLRPDRMALVIQPAGHQQLDNAAFDQLAVRTRETLRCYFTPWVEFVPQEMIGTFIATLGIHPSVIANARHFLGPRTIEETRAELDGCAKSGTEGGFLNQVTHYTIACAIHDSMQANVLSLLGNRFPTELRGTSSTIFLGDGVEIQPIQLGQYYRHTLHLRRLNLNNFSSEQLFDLLQESTRVVLSRVYGLREVHLWSLWKRLGQVAQLHIRIAQNRVVDAAQAFLRQVGAHQVAEVQAVMEDWNVADRRRAEAEEAGRQVSPAVEQQLSQAKQRLRDLLAGHPHTQKAILATVQRKINRDYGYESISVPFEIWQNADDAVVELKLIGRDQDSAERLGLVLKTDATGIAFAHWGRLVNEFRGADGSYFPDRHFDEDLEKMVVQAISDKRSGEQVGAAVTGKFGLGFKSVFLVSDAPEVVSGSVDFVIRGGIYPIRMDGVRRDELVEELKQLDPEHFRRGTIIRLPLRTNGQPNSDGVLALFERLAPLLVVFSRKLKRLRLRCEGQAEREVRWKPEQVAEGIEVGELQSLDEEAPRALVFGVTTGNDRLQLLLGLDSDGFVSLPDDVPMFWVTAPTRTTPGYGFAVNGPFEPDVGRVQLAPQSKKNHQLAEELAAAFSYRLVALHAKTVANWDVLRSVLQLTSGTTASHFWESLWEVLARIFAGKCRKDDASPGASLTRRILWGSTADGLQAFYRQCAALPTGLWGDFSALTKLPELRFVADGALDREDVFKAVSQWRAFHNQVSVGAICSHRLVASTLTSLGITLEAAQPVKLADVVAWELSERRLADPDLAIRLGKLITPDFMKKLREGMPGERNEQEQIVLIELLSEVQFQAADGSWLKPTELVVVERDEVDVDEKLRAAFAPQVCRLNPAYIGPGLAFFLACRPRLAADVEAMAKWILLAASEPTRLAALQYLLNGQLKDRLAEELRRQRDNNNWLWQLGENTWFQARFTADEQHQIRAYILRLFDDDLRERAVTLLDALPQPEPEPIHVWTVAELWKWWHDQQGEPTGDYTLEGEANWELFHGGALWGTEERKAELKRLLQSPDDPAGKALWYRLFGYACLVSAGRTMTELREFWIEQLKPRQFWERTSDGDFSEKTQDIFEQAVTSKFTNLAAGGEQAYFWRRVFYDIRKVHRMVQNEFPAVLLDLVKQGHGEHLRQFLSTGHIPGPDQRPWIGTFGQSAATPLGFVIRELVRLDVITDKAVLPYAFYVCRPVLRALVKIGWIADVDSGFSGERWLMRLQTDPENGPNLMRGFDIPLLHMGIMHRGDKMPRRPD